MKNGTSFALKNSSYYDIHYNESLDEYYLYSDESTINLQFYIPNTCEKINVYTLDLNDSNIQTTSYDIDDSVSLINTQDVHYRIEAFDDKKNESVTIYTFWGEE